MCLLCSIVCQESSMDLVQPYLALPIASHSNIVLETQVITNPMYSFSALARIVEVPSGDVSFFWWKVGSRNFQCQVKPQLVTLGILAPVQQVMTRAKRHVWTPLWPLGQNSLPLKVGYCGTLSHDLYTSGSLSTHMVVLWWCFYFLCGTIELLAVWLLLGFSCILLSSVCDLGHGQDMHQSACTEQ